MNTKSVVLHKLHLATVNLEQEMFADPMNMGLLKDARRQLSVELINFVKLLYVERHTEVPPSVANVLVARAVQILDLSNHEATPSVVEDLKQQLRSY